MLVLCVHLPVLCSLPLFLPLLFVVCAGLVALLSSRPPPFATGPFHQHTQHSQTITQQQASAARSTMQQHTQHANDQRASSSSTRRDQSEASKRSQQRGEGEGRADQTATRTRREQWPLHASCRVAASNLTLASLL